MPQKSDGTIILPIALECRQMKNSSRRLIGDKLHSKSFFERPIFAFAPRITVLWTFLNISNKRFLVRPGSRFAPPCAGKSAGRPDGDSENGSGSFENGSGDSGGSGRRPFSASPPLGLAVPRNPHHRSRATSSKNGKEQKTGTRPIVLEINNKNNIFARRDDTVLTVQVSVLYS